MRLCAPLHAEKPSSLMRLIACVLGLPEWKNNNNVNKRNGNAARANCARSISKINSINSPYIIGRLAQWSARKRQHKKSFQSKMGEICYSDMWPFLASPHMIFKSNHPLNKMFLNDDCMRESNPSISPWSYYIVYKWQGGERQCTSLHIEFRFSDCLKGSLGNWGSVPSLLKDIHAYGDGLRASRAERNKFFLVLLQDLAQRFSLCCVRYSVQESVGESVGAHWKKHLWV